MMQNIPDELYEYERFEVNEFISDPGFQEWTYCPTEENEFFWKSFVTVYPHKAETVSMARKALMAITYKDHTPSDEDAERSLRLHLAQINKLSQKEDTPTMVRPMWNYRLWIKVAAVFAGVALLSAILLYSQKDTSAMLVQHTEFGETRRITLPDGSMVTLNANSTLKYAKKWNKAQRREVWLEGEGLFDVVHINKNTKEIKDSERFVVHTSDVDVQVLGTLFDIRRRRGHTAVVLQRGSVKVALRNVHKTYLLQPGEMLRYEERQNGAVKERTEAAHFTAWTNKKLIIKDATLEMICEYLEDNYGKKIIIADPSLSGRKINGPVLLNSLNDALFVISSVLQLEVGHPATDTISLRSRKNK